MRIVKLTRDDVEETIKLDGDHTLFTGTDEESGERVTFKLHGQGFADVLISVANRDGAVALFVADFQIVSVEPVRGEWDSPGTSPEEGS